MRLEGPEATFELRVISYQFSDADDWWDANWLVVEIMAAVQGRRWSARDAAMLTIDVAELANWLERVGTGRDVPGEIDFAEPCLAFAIDGGGSHVPTLLVTLAHGCGPPWLDGDARMVGVRLPFGIDPPALLDASASLRQQLRSFPMRGERQSASE